MKRKEHQYGDFLFQDRLERVGPFLAICVIGFALFSLYYQFSGHDVSAWICAASSISGVAGIFIGLKWPSMRVATAHGFIAASCVALVVLSMISGGGKSHTPVFFCCAGLLAGHVLGIRAAKVWTLIAVVCLLVINTGFFGDLIPQLQHHTPTDQLLTFLGLTVIIYFMSCQAERYFEKHATRLVSLTEELQERTRLLNMAEEVANVGHWRLDTTCGEIVYSGEACKICELDLEPDVPHPFSTFLQPFPDEAAAKLHEAISLVRADSDTSFTVELSFEHGERHRFITIQGLCEQDDAGMPAAVFGIIKDETEAKRAATQLSEKAAALQQLAAFDVLTGLANRFRFQEEFQDAIEISKATGVHVALLLIDMDGFKEINDTLGHPVGDEILRMIANRLKGAADEGDTVARLGGDEFTVILNDIRCADDVYEHSQRISDVISQPYYVGNKEIILDSSIGAALCPEHSEFMDELLAFADTAMYEAKSKNRHLAVYDPQMTEALVRRRELEAELSQALSQNEFRLVYQPQYRIDGKSIVGFEALLRWERKGKTVSPLEFVPLLEQTGAILAVGEWILGEACQQAQQWVALGHDITMSVNISPVQFRDRNFVKTVMSAIDAGGLAPERLDLEVTENVFIDDVDMTAQRLFQLKDHGISISIDDFGTGYSSLAYLKHFPIDRLKIDRAFVKDIPSTDDGTIASSIVGLGHNLEMKVLAEGVETHEQLRFLGGELCDEIQGYLFSKPVSPTACLKLLIESTESTLPAQAP